MWAISTDNAMPVCFSSLILHKRYQEHVKLSICYRARVGFSMHFQIHAENINCNLTMKGVFVPVSMSMFDQKNKKTFLSTNKFFFFRFPFEATYAH